MKKKKKRGGRVGGRGDIYTLGGRAVAKQLAVKQSKQTYNANVTLIIKAPIHSHVL
jgi:hypothetical protein